MKRLSFVLFAVALAAMGLMPVKAQSINYSTGFETSTDTAGWVLLGGSQTNKWAIGTAAHNAGSHGLYVSSDNGTSAGYSTSSISFSYAYYQFTLSQAAALEIGFDWKCYGESSWDYIRVFLAPASATLTPGQTPDGGTSAYSYSTAAAPADWIDVSNGKLNYDSNWQSLFATFNVSAGTWRLVFLWCNDGGGGSMPGGCIDNVSIVEPTCPRPSNLTFSGITSDSCTISWHERGQATSWVLEYADSSFLPGCYQGDVIWASDTIYSLDNLQPNTTYYVYLHADCGGDTSINIAGSFTTNCVAMQRTDLPMTENFERGGVDHCWKRFYVENGAIVDDTSRVYVTTSYAASGSHSLYLYTYYYNNITAAYAVLPMMEDSVGDLDISFKLYDDGSITIVTMSDPNDMTTFRNYRTFTGNGTGRWMDCDATLVNIPQGHRYVALAAVDPNNSVYSYVDDVMLTVRSNCPRPQSISLVGTASADSTTVAWHGNDPNVYQWNVVLVPAGGNPDTCQNIITVYDSTYLFQNLRGGASYDVYVRSDCGSEVSTWRGPLNFVTGVHVMGTSGTSTITTCSAVIVDDGGLTGDYSDNCDVTLIVRSPDPDSVLYITGSYYTESSWDELSIYDGASTAATPLLNAASGSGAIGPFVSSGNAITIHFSSDGSVEYDGFQINVSCFAIPDCYIPVNLTAMPGVDSCIINWEELGGSSSWSLEYGPHGFTRGNGTIENAFDTIYALSGLTANRQYDCYVWANCNSGDASDTAMVTFTTLPGRPVSTYPYVCTFADTAITNPWVLVNGTETNKWYIGTAAHNGTADNYGLYISDGNGSNNNYSTSDGSYVFAYRTFSMPAGQYVYSFDWRADGESSYDYIRVALVPGMPSFTAGDSYYFSNLPSGSISLDNNGYLNGSSVWTTQNGTFTISAAGNYNLVFYWRNDFSSGDQPPAAIDNVMIMNNSCPMVTNLVASNVTTTSATFTWTAGGGESSWLVRCGNSVNEVYSPTATFNNLTVATAYTCSVRPICGVGDTGIATSISFSTPCNTTVVTAQGYSEGFEGLTDLPNCWTEEANGAYWEVDDMSYYGGTTTTPHGGSNVLLLQGYGGDNSRLISPVFDLSALTSPKITFWHMQEEWFGYQDELQVCVRANTSSRWAVLATYQSSIASWQCDTLSLAGYTTAQISFLGTGNDGNGIVLDDIFIGNVTGGGTNPPTPCNAPTGLATSSTTTTSATVSWSGSGNFEVAYKAATSSSWGASTSVSATTYTFTGLTANTQYDWRVRKVCSATEQSDWVTSSFTTQQGGGDPDPCNAPTGLSVAAVTNSSATVTWTGSGNFEVAYKASSTSSWSNSTSVTTNSYTINGLNAATQYDWRVRKVCSATEQSDWASGNFTTERGEGISTASFDGIGVTVYPNPATNGSDVEVSIKGADGVVTVTLLDITGRTLQHSTQNCQADCTKRFDLHGVARGTYFVKVQTEGSTKVQKLVVR